MRNQIILVVFLLLLFYFSIGQIHLLLFLIVFGIVFSIIFFSHFVFGGAPFVRTPTSHISSMISLSNPSSETCMIDLGSGMGDILFEFSKVCDIAHGLEINPLLFVLSKLRLSQTSAKVYRKNIWKFDVSRYDIVTLYGIPNMMQQLEYKLLNELKPGARVVSNKFPFPNWKHVRVENDVYLYTKG